MFNRFILTSLLSFGISHHALASGMEIPEQGARSVARGGAIVSGVNDGTATWLNPSALSKIDGFMFSFSHNLLWLNSEFSRLAPEGDGAYLPTSSNEKPFFPINMFGAISYDFGTDHSTMALSIHGPNTSGNTRFSQQDSTRYLLNELDVLFVYYGLSYAYGSKNFGFGVTAQYVHLPRLNFGLVVDANPIGSNARLEAESSRFDVRADLEMEDPGTLSAVAGFWWQPIDEIELAATIRPFPIRLNPDGTAKVTLLDEQDNLPGANPTLVNVSKTSAGMALDLPRLARLGARYRHLEGDVERFDLEVNATYVQWSSIKGYDAKLDGSVQILAYEATLNDVLIEKNWKDAYSLSVGGSYWLSPNALELMGGAFWESAAAEPGYAHLDFPAGERVGYGLGLSWFPVSNRQKDADTGLRVGFTLAYGETFQHDIEVGPGEGRVYQQRPLSPCPENCMGSPGIAVNEGLFKTHFRTLSLALNLQGL